jgi:hypothetical protein
MPAQPVSMNAVSSWPSTGRFSNAAMQIAPGSSRTARSAPDGRALVDAKRGCKAMTFAEL